MADYNIVPSWFTGGVWNTHPSDVISHYETRNNETLEGLDSATRTKAVELFKTAFKDGYLLLFYSGLRTFAEQDVLYKKYLSGEGGLAAPPGSSWHNYGRAIDVMIIKPDRTGTYDNMNVIAAIAEPKGFEWGGSWGDPPHFANKAGTSIAELKAANSGWEQYIKTSADETNAESWDNSDGNPGWWIENKKKVWTGITITLFVAVVGIIIYFVKK